MSEVQKSIDNKNFLFNLDFQSFLIFIFTFSIIVRLSYGFFINGDLYIWSFGSVSQGILRTTSRLIENNLKIELSGHTDNVGDPEGNYELSLKRATSVKDFLIELGCNPELILTSGKGDTEPVESNETSEGRQKNRRVTVKFIR